MKRAPACLLCGLCVSLLSSALLFVDCFITDISALTNKILSAHTLKNVSFPPQSTIKAIKQYVTALTNYQCENFHNWIAALYPIPLGPGVLKEAVLNLNLSKQTNEMVCTKWFVWSQVIRWESQQLCCLAKWSSLVEEKKNYTKVMRKINVLPYRHPDNYWYVSVNGAVILPKKKNTKKTMIYFFLLLFLEQLFAD